MYIFLHSFNLLYYIIIKLKKKQVLKKKIALNHSLEATQDSSQAYRVSTGIKINDDQTFTLDRQIFNSEDVDITTEVFHSSFLFSFHLFLYA